MKERLERNIKDGGNPFRSGNLGKLQIVKPNKHIIVPKEFDGSTYWDDYVTYFRKVEKINLRNERENISFFRHINGVVSKPNKHEVNDKGVFSCQHLSEIIHSPGKTRVRVL